MTGLSLCLLGSFQLTLDGDATIDLASAKARALLAYLAVESDRPHPRQALAALLWPEHSESRARANLSQALFLLRGALGDPLIGCPLPGATPGHPDRGRLTVGSPTVGRPPEAGAAPMPLLWVTAQTIQFNIALASVVDVARLTASLDRCARHPHTRLESCAACMERLQQAVALYRGLFLEHLSIDDSAPYEEWAVLTREHLHNRVIEALHSLAEGLACRGECEQALTYARRQVEFDPWREEAQCQLMRLLALSGRRSEALVQYETCRRSLEGLSAEPSAETKRLYEQIRTGAFNAPTMAAPSAKELQLPRGALVKAPGQASPPRQLFVGREGELVHLDGWLKEALAGQGRVGFVVGGPGSGKTTLLGEFARLAMDAHHELVAVHGASGASAGIADPCLPFLEILRLLMGDVEPRRAAGTLSPEHARRLQAIAPATLRAVLQVGPPLIGALLSGPTLLERARAMPDAAACEAQVYEALRSRGAAPSPASLFDQVTLVFQALAHHQPLLIAMDDLHWSDSASISLLFHLGRRLAGQRILVLGAYRPEELALEREGQPHPLAAVSVELEGLWRRNQVDLDRAEGRAFVDALVDSEPNRLGTAFREALYRRTGGRALFAVELCRSLQQRGDLARDADGRWTERLTLDWRCLPERVETVAAERIARLSPEERGLLSVASVEGDEFHAEVVARVLAADEAYVLAALGGALSQEQGLVASDSLRWLGDQRFSCFRFRHHLWQQHLYQSLGSVRRAELHAAVASALEALGAAPSVGPYPLDAIEGPGDTYADFVTDPEPVVSGATLAWHWDEAGQTEKAAAYHFRELSRLRLLAWAPDETLAHGKRFLDLLATLPIGSRRTCLQYLGYHALGSVLSDMRGPGAPEVEQALRRSLDLAEESGDPLLVAAALSALAECQRIAARRPWR